MLRCGEIIDAAKQQRQVFKVLLDGLNDTGSPLSKLLGVQKEVFEEIIWQVDLTRLRITVVTVSPCCPNRISNDIICQEVVENWEMFPA